MPYSDQDFMNWVAISHCLVRAPAIEVASWLSAQPATLAPAQPVGSKTLGDCLSLLLPRVAPLASRWLVLQGIGEFSMILDNFRLGTDARYAPLCASQLKCQGLRCVSSGAVRGVKYRATMLEVFENGVGTRTVYAADDGGRWKFGQSGAPMTGEEPERYSSHRTRDRFQHGDLLRVLEALGANSFAPAWYGAPGTVSGFLLARHDRAVAEYAGLLG